MSDSGRMSFADACRELKVSEAELEALVAAGEIASLKEGDTLFFTQDAVERFKESRDPTVLLADDEINFFDDDGVDEIDLLADDEGGAETTDVVSGREKVELNLDDGEIDLTSDLLSEASADDTVLTSDDSLLEGDLLEAEGTTPIASGAADLGDDTLLDTELLDLGDEDTFDLSEDLGEDDLGDDSALLRGGGARVMQMKRKESGATMTVLLAVSSLVLLLPLAVLTNMLFQRGSDAAKPEKMYAWIKGLNVLDPVVQWVAGLFS